MTGQVIDGCPMYGCRPSGTFSFTLDVPRSNASIGWVTDFFIGPVPGKLVFVYAYSFKISMHPY